MDGEFQKYAEVQCYKIAHFLQQVRQIEILKMMAEFVRDDQDNVWFVFANKISYRRIAKAEGAQASNEAAMLEALKL